MAIEIKTRPKKREIPPLLVIGVILCLLIILGTIASYVYFYLDINKTEKAITEKEIKAQEVDQEIAIREAELRPLKAKVEQYAKLIAAHASPLEVFSFLEDNCLPEVYFSSIDIDVGKKTVSLTGHAEDFGTLEQQAGYLKLQPEVASLNISSVTLDEDEEIDFSFNIIFNASIFVPQIEEEIIEGGEQ